ncbi:MAG: transporter [Actinomycetia bacterium]|nr:transporter [Actinomycetes bacterium]
MLHPGPSVARMAFVTLTETSAIPADPHGAGPASLVSARPALVTPALLLRFVSMIGASTSFYLLLSVLPVYAGGNAAGLVTGALMLSTVAGELATPRLLARFGYRRVLAAGLLLLGLPALALMAPPDLATIVAVCFVRGLGFAFTVVAGGALTASLIPPERRGEGLALAGVVAGVPAVVALPFGLWLAARGGYPPVFVAAAVAALAALASVPWLPERKPAVGRAVGVVAGLRTAALVRPAIAFSATTMAAGVVVTFLPLAVTRGSASVAALALLAQSATSTLTRWRAGRHGDRHGPAGLVIPGLLTSTAGMLTLALTASPTAVMTGAVIFGAGFGITQNATLTLMYARVPASGYGTVSALWNLAYDAGLGLGAVGFGALATRTGYSAAFALTAALMLTGLPAALRDRRGPHQTDDAAIIRKEIASAPMTPCHSTTGPRRT